MLRALAALSPFVAMAALVGSLRPVPAVTDVPDRSLVLARGADSARRFPGRAAIDPSALDRRARFDTLPFDELLVEPEILAGGQLDLTGFEPAGGGEGAFTAYRRVPHWSLVDSWPSWKPAAWHGDDPSTRLVCPFRFDNGGWGCGRRVQMIPDVIDVGDELWGVARFTALPARSHLELEVAGAPAGLIGHLVPLASGEAPSVAVRRDGVESLTQCDTLCPLLIPPGDGPLTIRLDGPNAPLALDLRQAP